VINFTEAEAAKNESNSSKEKIRECGVESDIRIDFLSIRIDLYNT
jgi:hypothetical protein